MDMRKLVGRNVKRIRQDRGLTQEELAERSGFSQLLNARGAQTRKAVGFKRTLPGEEFLFGGVVAT
jgi:transcriptional regulator with XRE-family HTH domain